MNIIKAIKLHRRLRIEEEILHFARIDYGRFDSFESFPLSNMLSSIEKAIDKIENKIPFLSSPRIFSISKILQEAKKYYYNSNSNELPYKWNIKVKINIWHFFKNYYR